MPEKEKALNFDISPDLHKQIDDESTRLGISVAGFLRMLAVQYFEKRQEKNESNQMASPGDRSR
jgi:hypothetical protein